MNYSQLQRQYDLIYYFFKSTTEPFDELIWDGFLLQVLFKGRIVEEYDINDLRLVIPIL